MALCGSRNYVTLGRIWKRRPLVFGRLFRRLIHRPKPGPKIVAMVFRRAGQLQLAASIDAGSSNLISFVS
jgi:hypothetical protein